MGHISCTVCVARLWDSADVGIYWSLQPPGVVLCDSCITATQEFLIMFDLAEKQPFFHFFQGKIDESESGEFWELRCYRFGQVTVRKSIKRMERESA